MGNLQLSAAGRFWLMGKESLEISEVGTGKYGSFPVECSKARLAAAR